MIPQSGALKNILPITVYEEKVLNIRKWKNNEYKNIADASPLPVFWEHFQTYPVIQLHSLTI